MNISLRKASALQNSINEAIKSLKVVHEVELNEFQPVDVVVAAAQQAFDKAVTRRNDLLVALYEVRKLVAEANYTSGIQTKLTRAALVDKQIGHVNEIASADVITHTDVLRGKLDNIRAQTANSTPIYGYARNVTTSILTQESIDQAKLYVLELKKTKQKINDEILELNISTKIELSEAVVKTLQTENLL